MNALSKLREKLKNREYRAAFVQAQAKRFIPLQIRVLMRQRGWSQTRLADESNLTQGVISRAQDPDYGNLTLNTLVRIAAGFDVAFVGRFVPFSELERWYDDVSEASLEVPSFHDDLADAELCPKEFEKLAWAECGGKLEQAGGRGAAASTFFPDAQESSGIGRASYGSSEPKPKPAGAASAAYSTRPRMLPAGAAA